MSREELLHQSPMLYRVLRDAQGDLVIDVLVGGIAMYEVRVPLLPDEIRAWEAEGVTFADRLARAIAAKPSFGGRSLPVPEQENP